MIKAYISKLPDEGDYEEVVFEGVAYEDWTVLITLNREDFGDQNYSFVDYKFKRNDQTMFFRRYLDIDTEVLNLNHSKNVNEIEINLAVSWIRRRDGVTRLN